MPKSTQLSNKEKERAYTVALTQLKKYESAFPEMATHSYRQWTGKSQLRSTANFFSACSDVEERLHKIIQKVENLKEQGEPIEDLTTVLISTHQRLHNQLDAKSYEAIAKRMQRKSSIKMKALGSALILLGLAILVVICLPMVPSIFGFASFASALAMGSGTIFFFSDASLSKKMSKLNNLVGVNDGIIPSLAPA